MPSSSSIVLGIYPGSIKTGYGLVRQEGSRLIHIHSGIIDVKKETSLDQKLKIIQNELSNIIQTHKPSEAALETIFYAKNVKSAITLAHARGVALCTAAQHNLSVFEYSPLAVKEACVGYGRAAKEQTQSMVLRMLNLKASQMTSFDQSDALAVAICHIHTNQVNKKISKYDSVHVY